LKGDLSNLVGWVCRWSLSARPAYPVPRASYLLLWDLLRGGANGLFEQEGADMIGMGGVGFVAGEGVTAHSAAADISGDRAQSIQVPP